MSRTWCSTIAGGVRIAAHIMPNAKKTEVIGLHDDALKIRLQAQPIEGKANEALARYIADRLGVPKTSVLITHGHTNKRKVLEVQTSLTAESVGNVLLPALDM
jgi:uncharacterized protein (TIGR00251 family)